MTNEYKLSDSEASLLLVNLLCSKLFLLTSGDFVSVSGSGALISVSLVFSASFLFFYIYTKKSVYQDILHCINSTPVKKIFGIVSSFLLIFSGSASLNLTAYFSKVTAFTSSPLSFLTIPFAVCMIFAASSGLKCIAKLNGFFTPVLYAALIILICFSYNSFDFTNLTPVFGKGFVSVFGNGFFLISNLFEFLILLYLPKNLKGSFKKVGFCSLLISFIIYLVAVSAFLLIGGKSPDLPLLSVIQSGHFRRTDSAFLLLFALARMLYLSTVLYFSVRIFCESLNITKKNLLVIPFALILISFSGISFFNSGGQMLLSFFSKWLWAIPFLIPIILTVIKEKHR